MTVGAPDEAPVAPEPPVVDQRQFGRYTLRYRVAQGGMASVYLAQLSGQEGFRKWVAIKTIHPHIATNKKFVQMFLNEARLAARLDHTNVCAVYDFGEAQGTYFLAMEYLHGESLVSVIRRAWREGSMPVEMAVRIVADAAHGLHSAHELRRADGTLADVVHRDVSPQNIFVLYNGTSKVVDFGIARSSENLGEETATGELKGKLGYMSPEQLGHGALDRRTDVYALGVVLWEALVGRRLFKRDTHVQTMMAVMRGEIDAPSRRRADVPEELDRIVLRALASEAESRFATAADFARDLEGWMVRAGVYAGHAEVSEFVRGLFAEQIAQREALLNDRGNGATPVPSVEVQSSSSLVLPGAGTVASLLPPGRGRVGLAALLGGALVVVLGLGIGIGLSLRGGGRSDERRSGDASDRAVAPPTPARAVTPPTVTAPVAPVAIAAPPPTPPAALPATPVQTAPSTVAAPVVNGYLNLVAVPSAEVFANGRRLGWTPLVHRALAPGRYTLRLAPADGLQPRDLVVTIRPGQVTGSSQRWR